MAKREYIEKNRAWLAEKSKEEGVKPLDKGIYYKVIARHPRRVNSDIRYRTFRDCLK